MLHSLAQTASVTGHILKDKENFCIPEALFSFKAEN